MPPKAAPQVPGEPTASTETEGQTTTETAGADQSVETVAVPKAQFDALLSRLDALETKASQPSQKVANPDALLPDQDSIDPAKIKTPQLSKQGWVVPTDFGAAPAPKK